MKIIGDIERFIVELFVRLGPIVAPIITAYVIARSSMTNLSLPLWVAVMVGIAVESLGIAATSTVLMLRRYNATKRQTDPTAPVLLSYIALVVYLLATMVIGVVLDGNYVVALFPTLTLAGVLIIAVRHDYYATIASIDQQKRNARADRRATKERRTEDDTKRATQMGIIVSSRMTVNQKATALKQFDLVSSVDETRTLLGVNGEHSFIREPIPSDIVAILEVM